MDYLLIFFDTTCCQTYYFLFILFVCGDNAVTKNDSINASHCNVLWGMYWSAMHGNGWVIYMKNTHLRVQWLRDNSVYRFADEYQRLCVHVNWSCMMDRVGICCVGARRVGARHAVPVRRRLNNSW